MDKAWEQVKLFHSRFGHPISDIPQLLDQDRVRKRYTWMLEEIDEFLEAERVVDQADAMIDLIYFALGTLVELGIRPSELFQIVHEANMSKLWEDGLPHCGEDRKTVKPPSWEDPRAKLLEAIGRMHQNETT